MKYFKNISLFLFFHFIALFSLFLQFCVVFGDAFNLTKEAARDKEIFTWWIIAILSIILLGLIYIYFKSNNKITKWFTLPASVLALAFPIAVFFSYTFRLAYNFLQKLNSTI